MARRQMQWTMTIHQPTSWRTLYQTFGLQKNSYSIDILTTYSLPAFTIMSAMMMKARQPSRRNKGLLRKKQTEAIPWKMSAGLFDVINLRPCKVISREPAVNRYAPQQQQQQQPGQGNNFYTAIIQNRPGLPPNERIPKGEKHIVSGIPRGAFRFVDRPYTSDVHLDGAFRQNIGLEETGLFPEVWFDSA
mmetsp:Transcript_946/g.1970  ORF Transcript_946/g.1970 Transcript_946/m.1970 type:complete len:190 (+) Transcript_946:1473-2042(+)